MCVCDALRVKIIYENRNDEFFSYLLKGYIVERKNISGVVSGYQKLATLFWGTDQRGYEVSRV